MPCSTSLTSDSHPPKKETSSGINQRMFNDFFLSWQLRVPFHGCLLLYLGFKHQSNRKMLMFHSLILILRKQFPQTWISTIYIEILQHDAYSPKISGRVNYHILPYLANPGMGLWQFLGRNLSPWCQISPRNISCSSHMQVHGVERQFASETQGHHHHARHPKEQDIMAFKTWWPKDQKTYGETERSTLPPIVMEVQNGWISNSS